MSLWNLIRYSTSYASVQPALTGGKFVQIQLVQFTLYEFMAVDNGGYLCMNSLRVLIAAWLDSSQRS